MTKVHVLNVGMTCGGCSGAVTRILTKIEGVTNIDANVETKIVKVTTADSITGESLVAALAAWSTAAKKTVAYVGVEEAAV